MAKKSKRGKKGKSKKGKKGKKKKEETPVFVEPPEPDTFFWVRRKNVSLFVEVTEAFTITELRCMVATILKHPIKELKLFKNNKELIERKEPPPKKPEKGTKGGSKATSKAPSKGSSKKGKKGKKGKDDKKKKEDDEDKPIIFTVGDYGLNPRTASVLNPATLTFTIKDPETEKFEKIDITPWSTPIPIPENVKPFLRNYKFEQERRKFEQEQRKLNNNNANNKAKK